MAHEIDESGNEIHVDVDEQIPTGICKICQEEREEENQPEEPAE